MKATARAPRTGARAAAMAPPGATTAPDRSWMKAALNEDESALPTGLGMLRPEHRSDSAGGLGPAVPSSHGVSAVAASTASTKHGICIDTLCKGYVNSFVDFFYLTHRTDQDTNRSEIPEAHLPQVQANLCSAERAHRRADSNRVLEAYEKLANYFQERGDYKTSVYFYEKCLDIAESTGNLGQQSIANNNLGVTHDALGDLPLATRFHERHLQIALQMLDDERIIYANKQLCDVYRRHAEQALGKNDVAAAVERFHKCLKCAIDSGDSRVEGTVTHQLGAACARAGDTTQALKWQLRYLELAKQTNDQLAEAEAYAAIAESYTALGDAEQAAKYLAWCNELSARNQQPKQQVEACTALGLNASKAGDYERAVAYFEKAYQIARGLNDQKLVDSARIHLGVARGNVGMGVYMDVVNKDLSTLLRWKTRRVNF